MKYAPAIIFALIAALLMVAAVFGDQEGAMPATVFVFPAILVGLIAGIAAFLAWVA